MNGQAAANTDETLLCKVAGKGAGRPSTPPHVHGYEANTGMPHAVQLHMSHTWALSLASPVIQWAKKKKIYGSSYLLALPPIWQQSYQVLRLPFCMRALRTATIVRELHHMLCRLCIRA